MSPGVKEANKAPHAIENEGMALDFLNGRISVGSRGGKDERVAPDELQILGALAEEEKGKKEQGAAPSAASAKPLSFEQKVEQMMDRSQGVKTDLKESM